MRRSHSSKMYSGLLGMSPRSSSSMGRSLMECKTLYVSSNAIITLRTWTKRCATHQRNRFWRLYSSWKASSPGSFHNEHARNASPGASAQAARNCKLVESDNCFRAASSPLVATNATGCQRPRVNAKCAAERIACETCFEAVDTVSSGKNSRQRCVSSRGRPPRHGVGSQPAAAGSGRGSTHGSGGARARYSLLDVALWHA